MSGPAPRSQALLTPQEYAAFSRRFGLDRDANFEGEWHLHIRESIDASRQRSANRRRGRRLIDSARAQTLKARNLRVWPARDEKILTAWNALMIKGLAIAARVLHRPDLADAATAAVDFIHRTLWRDGRLLATYKDGRAHLPAYLDDYAFLADALLELLQTRWRSSDLEFARQLWSSAAVAVRDPEPADFSSPPRTTSGSSIAARPSATIRCRPAMAVAASVLCRLGYLLGELPYLDAAERTCGRDGPCSSNTRSAHEPGERAGGLSLARCKS